MFRNLLTSQLAAFAMIAATPASAQADRMTAIATPEQADAIALGTGSMPGATTAESWHSQYGSVFARNVVDSTVTPFLADPAIATGSAVIVAPGGGFRTLSMENEGWQVAQALNERGVSAFVLKYRLNQTPADLQEFASLPPPRPATDPGENARPMLDQRMASIGPMIEDAEAAFALIRVNAAAWGVDPDRIGMIGFSAGAALTMATAITSESAKPAFLADIYGPLGPLDVPAEKPPLFIALAADDPLFNTTDFGIVTSWKDAGAAVEFHYYEQGGHGFGMYQKETTSTGWFDAFTDWLVMHGFARPLE
ncbi:alpha/beta hydrolase [Qipengyuania sp. NPDC077563]|uniref:alpha/beta hydrolase n=1 Tax=Qipengyuania sp. NPDC077563 TaxID=3364497 RepID=UPI0038508DFA